jgi:ubiquinone biosynthesis protein UbiJ
MYLGFQSGLMGSLGSAVTSLGTTFGSSAVASFGYGLSASVPGSGAAAMYASASASGNVAAGASAGMSAGTYAIPIAGWIAAGMMLSNSLYKQGWDANNGSVNMLGKTVNGGMFIANDILKGVGLSNSAANILAGMGPISKLFGRKNPEIESQGIEGTFNATGFVGDTFANILEKGGWFRSDKRYTKTADLSEAQDAGLDSTMQSMIVAVHGFAAAIGVGAESIDGYSKQIKLELTNDEAKNQELVAKLFGDIGDELAKKLVPSLDQFSQRGETASETLQRLAGDFQATTQVAQLLGKSAADVFGTTGIESAAARERLVTLAGGTSTLTSQASAYAQNYLTEEERLAPVAKAVEAALADMGLAAVTTREQFKAVVSGLDLTTEAGAKEFVSLMQLADAFAQVHPAAADAATAAQKAADALKAIKDAGSALLGDVDSSFSVLQKVVEREKSAVQTVIDVHTAAVSKLQSLSQSLHSTLDSLKSPDQQAMARTSAQAQIRAVLASVRAGGALPDSDSLKDAMNAVAKSSTDQFATYQDYLKDLYQTQSDIAALGNVTDDQLSVEQKALAAAQGQLTALDKVLSSAQDQIDILKGQSTSLLSIDQAMQGVSRAILLAQANPINAATQAVNTAYQSALGRAPDAAGLAYWQQQAANGVPASDITSAISSSAEAQIQKAYKELLGRSADASGLNFWLQSGTSVDAIKAAIMQSGEYKSHKSIPGFASGGDFGGGWRIVGENGPELEATGPARIFNAQQTSSLMSRLASPSDNSAALLSEIKTLRAAVERLEQKSSAENVAQVKQQQTTNDMLQRVIYGGDSIQTKVVS